MLNSHVQYCIPAWSTPAHAPSGIKHHASPKLAYTRMKGFASSYTSTIIYLSLTFMTTELQRSTTLESSCLYACTTSLSSIARQHTCSVTVCSTWILGFTSMK